MLLEVAHHLGTEAVHHGLLLIDRTAQVEVRDDDFVDTGLNVLFDDGADTRAVAADDRPARRLHALNGLGIICEDKHPLG